MKTFVGSYINDLRLGAIASLVAQEHAIFLSAPGWGKTDALESAARNSVGTDRRVFIRFAPSTPPQKVEGMFDPAQAIANPPKFVLVRDGTCYDKNAYLLLLDEVGRPSDIVFDMLLDVLDRRDIPMDLAPVVWGTSNFAPTSARTEALRDRFAIWQWLHPGSCDIAGVIKAHASHLHDGLDIGDMPDWKTVQSVRSASPGKNALKTCTDILTLLAQEASKAGLSPNPRRTKQWFRLLFRMNVYKQGKADFTYSDEEASKVLLWAWACTDENSASAWAKIASCVIDIVGTAITALKTATLDEVKRMMQMSSSSNRTTLAVKLGEVIASGNRELEQLGSSDPRVKKAIDELQDTFAQIVQGKNPFGDA